jgi:uncharacterized membrane protein
VFCVLAKPSQLALGLLELGPIGPRYRWRTALLIVLLAGFCALASVLFAVSDIPARLAGLQSGLSHNELGTLSKIRFMLLHPEQFFAAVAGTLNHVWELWRQLIGVLGWLDVSLDQWSYATLTLLLGLSIFDTLTTIDLRTRTAAAIISLLSAACYCVGVLLIFYIMLTPPDAVQIYGLQGRYFLVIMPLVAIAAGMLVGRTCKVLSPAAAIAISALSFAAMTSALWRIHWL